MDVLGYEQAVREQKDRLHSYAVWMLHDLYEAQDVTQEALLRLWTRRKTVPVVAARPWLTRTVHNLCLDRLRRRKTRRESDLDDVAEPVQRDDPGPERAAGSTQIRGEIGRALAGLTPRDRAVVVMREVQGMPYGEIAETLGMPLGTLKAALHRARDRLRRALLSAGVEP